MKKTVCILLCLALLLPLLVGCGSSGNNNTTTGTPTNAPESTGALDPTNEPTAEPTVEVTEPTFMADPGSLDVNGDGTIKLLMVGDSFSYYFVEELAGMCAAAGFSVRISNVYKGGCKLVEHWTYLNNNEAAYQMFTTIKFRNELSPVDLKTCLDKDEWDVISLHQTCGYYKTADYQYAYENTSSYAKNLYDYFRTNNPNAILYWHTGWAYQVGWEAPLNTDPSTVPEAEKILTAERQEKMHQTIVQIADTMVQENDVLLVPSSYAWQIARADSRVGDVLCARAGVGENNSGDYYHDGDIGGGQYLNACIWFEILTHTSCIGNTYRPTYIQGQVFTLSEDVVTALQEAAHAAVAMVYGEDYAK